MSRVSYINSVGIDIGTTTTSIIFSKLMIENVSIGTRVPKMEIVKRTILYRSKLYNTPFQGNLIISSEIINIINIEYEKASLSQKDIQTGAVIITGEAARKENSEAIIRAIANLSGIFVVTIAGSQLEAYLAGKGSGAASISEKIQEKVMNVDIGGGTTNIALFDKGVVKKIICENIGGRLIWFEKGTYIVRGITKYGEIIAKENGIKIEVGREASEQDIFSFCDFMAESLLSIINGKPNKLAEILSIGPLDIDDIKADNITFSGGVGKLIYEDMDSSTGILTNYGDIGEILARCILMRKEQIGPKILTPPETVYATVIGAGVYTTELSGSTIYISNSEALPIRDVPIIKFEISGKDFYEDELSAQLKMKIKLFSGSNSKIPAILIPEMRDLSFKRLSDIATIIINSLPVSEKNTPIIVICEDDIGKAIGNIIKSQYGSQNPIISIDEISLEEGDYIDIGSQLEGSEIVPVTIKTLVFEK